MHKWVMSFDLNSLYPHLIMQYNISPETVNKDKRQVQKMTVDKLLSQGVDMSEMRQRQLTMTPNGALFKTNKKGFLSEMMETMYNDRVNYKRLMLQSKQQYEDTKDPKCLKDISKYNNIQMAKRYHSTLLMVRLVTSGFDIMIYLLQRVSQLLVSYLFVGLRIR